MWNKRNQRTESKTNKNCDFVNIVFPNCGSNWNPNNKWSCQRVSVSFTWTPSRQPIPTSLCTMLAEIIGSSDSSNHTPNKHSAPLISTFRAITDARKRHLNIALISLFTCKQIQKPHWQCCSFFFFLQILEGAAAAAAEREKKKKSVLASYQVLWQVRA